MRLKQVLFVALAGWLIVMIWTGRTVAAPVEDDTETSISDVVLRLRAKQAAIRVALGALDTVLRVPDAAAPGHLVLGDMDLRTQGVFAWEPRIITINSRVAADNSAGFTTLHEAGHWFDACVLAPALLGKVDPGTSAAAIVLLHPAPAVADLTGWRDAVLASDLYRSIKRIQQTAERSHSDNTAGFCRYLTSPEELWARSFAQWMVLRSGNAQLRRGLTDAVGVTWPLCGAWRDKDFEPIAAALDRLMGKHQWIK